MGESSARGAQRARDSIAAAEPKQYVTVEGLVERARAAWSAGGDSTPATLDKCGETAARFARRLTAQGVQRPEQITAAHCQGFVNAATRTGQTPELTTRHGRRTAVRMLMRTLRELGYDVGAPTIDLRLPRRTNTTARPLTDLEVTLCGPGCGRGRCREHIHRRRRAADVP